jgi:hypothetical protein
VGAFVVAACLAALASIAVNPYVRVACAVLAALRVGSLISIQMRIMKWRRSRQAPNP